MTFNPPFTTKYDQGADVLYVTFEQNEIVRGVEDRNGIVWRYDEFDNLAGIIVLDFFDRWGDHKRELATMISSGADYSSDATLAMIMNVLH